MAILTPEDRLEEIVAACARSAVVEAYSLRTLDADILSLRVHLTDGSFVEVFYNTATDRTAFALILEDERVYGKDNAKIGWHVHPVDDPQAHRPCTPVSFEELLAEVVALRFQSSVAARQQARPWGMLRSSREASHVRNRPPSLRLPEPRRPPES